MFKTTTYKLAAGDTRPTLTVRAFQFPHLNPRSLRKRMLVRLAAVLAWCFAWRGYLVLLVGDCASGKTLLANAATPSRVLSYHDFYREHRGLSRELTTSDIAPSVFTLDEPAVLEPSSVEMIVGTLAQQSRGFLVCLQSLLRCPGLLRAWAEHRPRHVVMIELCPRRSAHAEYPILQPLVPTPMPWANE